MKDILQKWLQEHLGLLIEMEKLSHYMKDGTMFVRILKHYDAVNSLSIDIQPSQDEVTCKINLIQLKVWFRLLGVDFNNEIIEDVLAGKISSCVNILYQLYLCLENKNSLHFVPKQKERLMRKHDKKFKVTELSLSDLKEKKTSYKNEYYYKYSCRLFEHDDIIKWFEKKHCKKKNPVVGKSSFLVPIDIKELKKSVKGPKIGIKKRLCIDDDVSYVRNELDRHSRVKAIANSCDSYYYNSFGEGFIDGHYKNTTKSNLNKCKPGSIINNKVHFLPPLNTKETPGIPSISNDVKNLGNYSKKLKCGIKLTFKSRCLSKNFCDLINNDIWDVILDNEEDDFRKIIAHRLLKQSLYERQLSMKFFQIMNQSEVQKQSYTEIEKRIKSIRQKLDGGDNEILSEGGSNIEDKPLSYQDYVLYYQDERKRTVELHRRLYAEKLKLRFQKHYALCLETIEDIIDIVIKKSEFKSTYEMPVPDRLWTQWKYLFHHGLPVFDVDEVSGDVRGDIESFELNRQTILNECDLDDYLDVQREWDCLFENDLSNEFLANFSKNLEYQFVIGYVVHRLLETKYPCQPPPKPANIPKYPFRVILNDVDDEDVIVRLRALLLKSEILVVDVNSAVKSCLQKFKDEVGYVNYDVPCKKNSLPSKKLSGSFKSSVVPNINANILQMSKVMEELSKVKSTQTSLTTLSENNEAFPFGEAAKLGGELFNMMLLGNELPTNLIVDIVIEYIKSNSHKINGWVLVNFPSTLFQASVLEYALTSKKFPYHLEDDTASVFDSDVSTGKDIKDLKDNASYTGEIEVRSSRIVPNPRECDGEDVFKTYFSKFLTAIKGQVVIPNCFQSPPAVEESDSGHSDSTLLLEHPEREGVPAINEFYREQGISYDFIYESFDLYTIKQLARHILTPSIEDNNRTPSVELFGDEVLEELAESDETKGYAATGIGRTEYTPTKAVKNFALATTCEHAAALSSFDLEHHICSNSCFECSSDDVNKDVMSKPGDKNWKYSGEPIPDNIAIALATFWENLETVYLNNLRDVFFLKRNTDYSLIPYIHYVTKTIHVCLNQEDDRQSIVTEFLDQYNGIHQVLRSDEEMKNELHLRIDDLKNQLVKLCENKRNSVEEMRRTLINQNWTYLQMAAIGNCFITMLQIAVDRCLRTLDLLKDYYYAMLGLFKSEPLIYNNMKLAKIKLTVEEEGEENIVGVEIIDRLLNYNNLDSTVNPVYNIIESLAEDVCSTILNSKSILDNVIVVEEINAMKVQKDLFNKKYKERVDLEKRPKLSKGKSRSTSKDEEFLKQLFNDTEALKMENSDKEAALKNLFLEWSCSVKGEVDRTLYSIEMIKKKALVDLLGIENGMASTFSHFYDAIMLKFNAECNCIDQLCLLFQLAVEEKTPIHADIVLNQDQLYVIKRPIEKIETALKLPLALEEMLFEESFTIKQLEEIKERLTHIAPDGIISQEAFITLIKSLIKEGANHGSNKLVPKIWNKLNQDEFSMFFRKVFGNTGLIEWRDFLIYCLDLPYPVTEDVIDAKLQFLRYDPQETETVSYDNYMNTTLWFHRELPENPLHALHNILAKEFLFSLYKVEDENLINYTLLLMAFCKDEDVKVGFGKGLSLLYGKAVIMFEEDLFLEKILSDHVHTGLKIVNHILEDIMEEIVETSCGVLGKDDKDLKYREQNSLDSDINSSTVFETPVFGRPLLTESMYNQFFRRHLALQWTSKIPYVVIITLLSIAFYPVFSPYYIFDSYSRTFDEVRAHIAALQEIGEYFLYSPAFFNHSWLETMLKTLHKFRALSLTNIIKEIITNRKSVADIDSGSKK